MSLDVTAVPAPTRRWHRLLRPAAAALAAGACVAFVAAVDPNQAGHYPTCPFYAVTGLYCPGCGSLRAVHALAHGDLHTALARNPLTLAGGLLVVALWSAWVRRELTGRHRRVAPPWAIWGLLAVVLAFWVLRNLPGFAFLAP